MRQHTERPSEDNALSHCKHIEWDILTLKNSLTPIYTKLHTHTHVTRVQWKLIKNFMRKKGSTQVTVRNKYLYRKKRENRFEPPSSKHLVGTFIFVVSLCFFFLFYSCVVVFFCPYFSLLLLSSTFSAINMILLSFSLWLLFCFAFNSLLFFLFFFLYYLSCL